MTNEGRSFPSIPLGNNAADQQRELIVLDSEKPQRKKNNIAAYLAMMTHRSFDFISLNWNASCRRRAAFTVAAAAALKDVHSCEMTALNVHRPRRRCKANGALGRQPAQRGIRPGLAGLAGITENLMDLASPSISINSWIEDGSIGCHASLSAADFCVQMPQK